MKTLGIFDIGGHSNEYDDYLINSKGRVARYQERVAPAVKIVRDLGRAPVVIERAPGSTFGNSGFSLAEFARIPRAEWLEYVRHVTMRKAPVGNQPARPPTVYQPYLASSKFAAEPAWIKTRDMLKAAGVRAWFEDVLDDGQAGPRMAEARKLEILAGREPVPTRVNPIGDPWIVDETLLLKLDTNFKGGGPVGWPETWLALAPGQDRTLIMPDRDATMDEVVEREEAGWKVAVRPHRVGALLGN